MILDDPAVLLSRLDDTVGQLGRCVIPDDRMADTIGTVGWQIRRLTEWKRGLLAEAGPTVGAMYRLEETRHADRTYNTPRLLSDCADALNTELASALRRLIEEGVVRLEWQWTGLNRFAAEHGVTLEVAKRAVSVDDLDAPHVAERWLSRLDVKAKEEQ